MKKNMKTISDAEMIAQLKMCCDQSLDLIAVMEYYSVRLPLFKILCNLF